MFYPFSRSFLWSVRGCFCAGEDPETAVGKEGEGETSQVQIPFSDSNNVYKIFAEFLSKRSRLQRNFGESLRNST